MTLIGHAHFYQFMEWLNLGLKTIKHAIYAPNGFLKWSKNQIPANFIYLSSSYFVTISYINYWDQVSSWINYRNSGMFHFIEVNQTPPPNAMLQDVWREATTKLATTNSPKYLQTTLLMGWGGLVSELWSMWRMWGIVEWKNNPWMLMLT